MPDFGQSTSMVPPGAALRAQFKLFAIVGLFGAFVNVLMLAGPIFALQVYDRVLGSRSVETLLVLALLLAFLILVMGILDYLRRRIAARIGLRISSAIRPPNRDDCSDELETLNNFFAAPVFIAIVDLPWLPVFLIGVAMFHPALGLLATAGAVLIALAGLANFAIRPSGRVGDHSDAAQVRCIRRDITHGGGGSTGLARSTGFQDHLTILRRSAWRHAIAVQDGRAILASVGHTIQLSLQSAMIGLGAYLVLQNQLTAGAIIASAVLVSRALLPLNTIAQNWLMLRQFGQCWKSLNATAGTPANVAPHAQCVPDKTGLNVDQITVFAPGSRRAAIRLVGFELAPGQAIGLVGPTGSAGP